MLLKIVRTQSRVATPNRTCSGRTCVWRGWRFIVTDNLKCGDREDGCLSSCHSGRKVAPHCYNTAATKVFCQGNMLENLKPRGTRKTVITQFEGIYYKGGWLSTIQDDEVMFWLLRETHVGCPALQSVRKTGGQLKKASYCSCFF